MIVVVGGGVLGLSVAIELQEAGLDVQIRAQQTSPRTTSDVAAAFWYPYRVEPSARVARWAAVSLQRFVRLLATPEAGVRMHTALDLMQHPPTPTAPSWLDGLTQVRAASSAQRPPDFAFGWAFDAPVIDMRKYMPWLMHQFMRRGGELVEATVQHLGELDASIIVNCAGLGARELCDDAEVFPIRGQLVHVDNPGIDRVLLDEHSAAGVAYIVPRGRECVLGGTAQDGDEDLLARNIDTESILERCRRLDPRLMNVVPRAVTVGLRPGRATIRHELERIEERVVAHCYGHGGAGVTLSWGCAQDIVNLLRLHGAITGGP